MLNEELWVSGPPDRVDYDAKDEADACHADDEWERERDREDDAEMAEFDAEIEEETDAKDDL